MQDFGDRVKSHMNGDLMILFDLMITIWLQWFEDDDDDVYDHDGYVNEQHTDAKVQLS